MHAILDDEVTKLLRSVHYFLIEWIQVTLTSDIIQLPRILSKSAFSPFLGTKASDVSAIPTVSLGW
jgi:hypothetical protein